MIDSEELVKAREAMLLLQNQLDSHNHENPWLGIIAAITLRDMQIQELEANLAKVMQHRHELSVALTDKEAR